MRVTFITPWHTHTHRQTALGWGWGRGESADSLSGQMLTSALWGGFSSGEESWSFSKTWDLKGSTNSLDSQASTWVSPPPSLPATVATNYELVGLFSSHFYSWQVNMFQTIIFTIQVTVSKAVVGSVEVSCTHPPSAQHFTCLVGIEPHSKPTETGRSGVMPIIQIFKKRDWAR